MNLREQEAYRNGQESMTPWLFVFSVGGLLIGFFIGFVV
jgi:hypothetical protein